MNEFEAVVRLLDVLGVKAIFAPLFAIIILLVLMKKYLFNGFSVFLKDTIKEWLQNEKDRVKNDVEHKEKIADVKEQVEIVAEAMWDNRRALDDRMGYLEKLLQEHVIETRNLILILKKRTDMVNNEESVKVDTQYFRQGGHTNGTSQANP